VAFVKGEFQSGCDEGAEVAFELVDAASLGGAGDRRQQEVNGDAETGKLPALGSRVAAFVLVGREALLTQAVADLGVLLIVEKANGQPDVEVVCTGMQITRVRVRADLQVDQQVRDQAANDAQLPHQRPEGHRDGQARRLDQLSFLA
jgi:hypothetical protein